MRTTLLLSLAGLVAALTGCAASAANSHSNPLAHNSCAGVNDADQQVAHLYAPGNVTRVQPLYRQHTVMQGRPSQDLAGAELFVPAPAGVSGAYLERALSCHAAGRGAGANLPNDPLRVAGVTDVDVHEVGPYLRVDIVASDRQAANDVLARAEALRSGHVKVQQLASAQARQAL